MIYLLVALLTLSLLVSGKYMLSFRQAFKHYISPTPCSLPRVSVVIAARNEADNLQELLPALHSQQYEGWWEIIVVNDRSSDRSIDLLHEWARRTERLRVIDIDVLPPGINGKKHAITQGIQLAEGEIILLTDADCLPASDSWVYQMSSVFNGDTEVVLGFSMYKESTNVLVRAFTYYETIYTALQYLGMALTGQPYMGVGRNLSYRKKLFEQHRGFEAHQEVTGGDDDLFVQQHAHSGNTRVVLGRESTTWSNSKNTVTAYYRQKIRHLSVGRRYSPAIKTKLAVITLSHIFGYIFMGVLMGVPGGIFWAAAGFGLRIFLVLATYKTTCQKLEIPFIAGRILLMDLLFPFYYVMVGLITLFRKKIQWN
jgi:cellulose synthase/poly-beta-1,6-N-acetylglucosamine synthase-like glycosyltransferase